MNLTITRLATVLAVIAPRTFCTHQQFIFDDFVNEDEVSWKASAMIAASLNSSLTPAQLRIQNFYTKKQPSPFCVTGSLNALSDRHVSGLRLLLIVSGDVEQNPGPVTYDAFSTSELLEILQGICEDDPETREQIMEALNARSEASSNLDAQQRYQHSESPRETTVETPPCETSNTENQPGPSDLKWPNYATHLLKECVTTDKHSDETYTKVTTSQEHSGDSQPTTSTFSTTPNQATASGNSQPSTSNSCTTPKNNSTERTIEQQNLDSAIKVGLDALNDLGRGNFESGVHFCPPHFFDHKFFTQEMAEAYQKGNFGDGPLRNFEGKIWEELIYHGLKANLPDLLETSIQSMWVFSGLVFARNSQLLSQFSINVPEETEIDLLVVGLTKTGHVFLVPIEIKKTKDGKTKLGKAKEQCKKYIECLNEVLAKALKQNDVDHFIRPVIFRCDNDSPSKELEQKPKKNNRHPKIFDLHLNEYGKFKHNAESRPETNLFSWISQMAFENENSNCESSEYQRLIGLLVFISSCKITNKKSHDQTTCYKHFELGGKGICMKGTMLCPKYVHEYIVKNIDFLTYLRTFYVKNNSESTNSDAFRTYSINKLPKKLMKIVQKYLNNITNEQLKALMREDKRVVLFGDYGAGKTLVLIFKAMEILIKIENGEESGRIRFMSKKNALEIDVIPRFRAMFSEETLAKYVTFQSWEDRYQSDSDSDSDQSSVETNELEKEFSKEDSISEEFCFFDEAEDTMRDVNRIQDNDDDDDDDYEDYLRAISCANVNTRLMWVVIASTHKHEHFKKHSELNGFVFHDLSWQLRNSHSISYFSKIMMGGADDETVRVNYPIYGARSRMHWCESKPDKQEIIDCFLNEVEYWMSQMKKGSILIYDMYYNNYEAIKEKIHKKINVELEDLRERTSCDSGKENTQDIRMYYTDNDDHLSGLEFDIVIGDSYNYRYWKVLSRAKYGFSWLYFEPEEEEKLEIERLSRWGRCEVIKH